MLFPKWSRETRRRTSATTDSSSAHVEEEIATAPSSVQSLELPEGADICPSTSAQSLQFANLSSVENTISPSPASATCDQVTDFSQHRFSPHQHHHGRGQACVQPRTPTAASTRQNVTICRRKIEG